LSILVVALLVVGVVSGTPWRHVIQVFPAAAVAVLLIRRVPWSNHAALPILLIWLMIMVVIWLYLLGIARITTGRFSTAEIVLTVIIGAASIRGLIETPAVIRMPNRVTGLLSAIGFAALQIGAIWLSTRPAFATS
jgi:hypothetical protein